MTLTSDAGGTIQGVAASSSAVTYTIFGDEVSPGTIASGPVASVDGRIGVVTLTDRYQPYHQSVLSITSSATPAINTDNYTAFSITALAVNITSMTSGLTGSPQDFDKFIIRILDTGVSRSIIWGSKYETRVSALPLNTVAGKVLTVGLIYDAVTAKYGCMAVGSAP